MGLCLVFSKDMFPFLRGWFLVLELKQSIEFRATWSAACGCYIASSSESTAVITALALWFSLEATVFPRPSGQTGDLRKGEEIAAASASLQKVKIETSSYRASLWTYSNWSN